MKILLAGAAGNLGQALVTALLQKGHAVTAVDVNIAPLERFRPQLARLQAVDLQRPETLAGLCVGMDCVITTVGIGRPRRLDDYARVDYAGNLNLLQAAQLAKVPKFVYTSIHQVEADRSVPMLRAKYEMEQAVKQSGLSWIILRPCGYFTDIWRTFMGSARKGSMLLVGRNNPHKFNPIHTADLAEWLVAHLDLSNEIVSIGGPENFTYREITTLCFELLGQPARITEMPVWTFDLLLLVLRFVNPATWAVMLFLRWASVNDLSAPPQGQRRLADYLREQLALEKSK